MRDGQLYLAGEWTRGAEQRVIRAPYDGAEVGVAGFAGPAEVEAAIVRGQEAVGEVGRLSPHARRQVLTRISHAIEACAEALAALIAAEAGKPITVARGEVARASQTFAFAAEECWRHSEALELGAVPAGEGRFGLVRRFPVGLVAAISPFNFPLNLVAHKLAPAFAAGCPVVLKPASQTPLTALRLAELCEEAGWPRGGLSVLPSGRGPADVLVTDERVRLLSFTGSPKVGWDMKGRAGKKRVVLELGGNAAVLVQPDTDLGVAAARAGHGAFVYAGQVCIAVQRIFVHERVYAPFRDALLGYVERELKVGDPRDPEVIAGPLIDEQNVRRVLEWIDEAKARGAKVLTGGTREGNLVRPAVLEGVPRDARLACEEAFGPVVTLEPYASLEEGVRNANDSAFGLQAGVFTDSLQELFYAYEHLEVGGVIHNDAPTFRVDHMPYGGVKDSGFGREGVPYAFDDYTEPRLLALRTR